MDIAKTNIESIDKTFVILCLRGEMTVKASVLIVLFAACHLTSLAQVSFGAKAGLNLNYMLYRYDLNGSRSENPDPNSNLGFHFGGYLQLPLSSKLFFQPELQFSRRGTGDNNLSYIELPLLISYSPFKLVQFEIGANVGLLISSSRPFFSDYQKNFEVGVTGGLRYYLPKGFFVGIRYYYGLSPAHTVDLYKIYQNINPNDPLLASPIPITLDTYHRNIQFSIGYKIR